MTMTKKEFLRQLRKAKTVFVWTVIYNGDGEYIQAVKGSLKIAVQRQSDDTEIMAKMRDDGDLYVA